MTDSQKQSPPNLSEELSIIFERFGAMLLEAISECACKLQAARLAADSSPSAYPSMGSAIQKLTKEDVEKFIADHPKPTTLPAVTRVHSRKPMSQERARVLRVVQDSPWVTAQEVYQTLKVEGLSVDTIRGHIRALRQQGYIYTIARGCYQASEGDPSETGGAPQGSPAGLRSRVLQVFKEDPKYGASVTDLYDHSSLGDVPRHRIYSHFRQLCTSGEIVKARTGRYRLAPASNDPLDEQILHVYKRHSDKQLSIRDIRAKGSFIGVSRSSIQQSITRLCDAGPLKESSTGFYCLAVPVSDFPRPRYVQHRMLETFKMNPTRTFRVSDLREDEGFREVDAYKVANYLDGLYRAGKITRVGRGMYALAQGGPAIRPPIPTKRPRERRGSIPNRVLRYFNELPEGTEKRLGEIARAVEADLPSVCKCLTRLVAEGTFIKRARGVYAHALTRK